MRKYLALIAAALYLLAPALTSGQELLYLHDQIKREMAVPSDYLRKTEDTALVNRRHAVTPLTVKLKMDSATFFSEWPQKHMLTHFMNSFPTCEPVLFLVNLMNDTLSDLDRNGNFSTFYQLRENKKVLTDHLDYLVDRNYVFYGHGDARPQTVKSIYLSHDNDIFMFSKINADRDYTGGFRFEFTTDWLKMRLIRKALNQNTVLSYQSLLVGGEGYTPHIRFDEEVLKTVYGLPIQRQPGDLFYNQQDLDLIQEHLRRNQELTDRPFASFQYIGRGKYRLHNHGHLRSKSYFKLGKVGGQIGKNIQAVIHQDLTTGSQRVLNWERQIANGGRLAVNTETQLDLALWSRYGHIFKHSGNRKEVENKRIPEWLNLYMPVEWGVGTVNTFLGTGFGFSTRNFTETSGHNDVKIDNSKFPCIFQRIYHNSAFNLEWRNRYVIHNSMLEGVGIWATFPDDPLDDEAVTEYTLRKEDVKRFLSTLDLSFSLRLRKMTVTYAQQRILGREFEVKNKVLPSPDFKPDPKYQTPALYGFGRFAINFMI